MTNSERNIIEIVKNLEKNIDESFPNNYKQTQVSFHAKLPNSIPIGDASTISNSIFLYINPKNFMETQQTGFQKLLNSMMLRRWFITLIVLITFMFTTFGILISIHVDTQVGQEWKELLLLLLGAFIGSYGKIIDYWFSDTDKDKMLVQKMDEEDGVSLSNTNSTGE